MKQAYFKYERGKEQPLRENDTDKEHGVRVQTLELEMKKLIEDIIEALKNNKILGTKIIFAELLKRHKINGNGLSGLIHLIHIIDLRFTFCLS